MLGENGIDNSLLKSEPIRRRKRYKKFKTSKDFFLKGFKDLAGPEDSTDVIEYSSNFKLEQPHISRDIIPIRVMTEVESRLRHPDVPHHWICGGKLLVLGDPKHPGNLKLFQVYFHRILHAIVSYCLIKISFVQ